MKKTLFSQPAVELGLHRGIQRTSRGGGQSENQKFFSESFIAPAVTVDRGKWQMASQFK